MAAWRGAQRAAGPPHPACLPARALGGTSGRPQGTVHRCLIGHARAPAMAGAADRGADQSRLPPRLLRQRLNAPITLVAVIATSCAGTCAPRIRTTPVVRLARKAIRSQRDGGPGVCVTWDTSVSFMVIDRVP